MKKQFSLASLFLLLTALCFFAPSAMAYAATEKQAAGYVSAMGEKAIDIIKNKSITKKDKATALESIFNDSVDFPWVARFVMGRFWRDATPDQRTRYTALYQRFLVLHYSSLFSDYTGGSFKILYARAEGDDEFTVGMQIQAGSESGEPVMIDYKIRAEDNKFKIFDVTIEGVSMLSTQRSEFASILNSKGVDYLIDQLQKKSASIVAAR